MLWLATSTLSCLFILAQLAGQVFGDGPQAIQPQAIQPHAGQPHAVPSHAGQPPTKISQADQAQADQSQSVQARTNVVLILVDNQGYFELGCKGNPFLQTPNIDRFASEGVDFCNFHAENFCSPSRAALLTGRQPMRIGVHNTVGGVSLLPASEVTLADRLQQAGYRTGIFGKWHLGMSYPFHPSLRGFDEVFVHGGGGIGQLEDFAGNKHMHAMFQHNGEWVKTSGYSTDVLFDRAMEFIESTPADKPFFCYIPTPAVHFPVEAEPVSLARIKQRGVPEDQTNIERLSMIENLDANLGRLLAHLEKQQLRENTLVLFMTDQGVGDRGSPEPIWPDRERQQDLGNASEGKHRVFCMLQQPGLTVAGQNNALACIRDIFPTILEACGQNVPADCDGRSLLALLKGQADWDDERIIVMQCPRARHREKWKHAAVKLGNWRLVSGGRLYDVSTDSLMERDISTRHPGLVRRLDAAYEEFWNSLPPESDLVHRHVLGAAKAPATLLCAMDWREGGAPWNSGALRDDFRGQGTWSVHVARTGRYRITLCRAMRETPMPVMCNKAAVRFGSTYAEMETDPAGTECVIELRLEEGDTTMQSLLSTTEKPQQTWGANFAYIEFVE